MVVDDTTTEQSHIVNNDNDTINDDKYMHYEHPSVKLIVMASDMISSTCVDHLACEIGSMFHQMNLLNICGIILAFAEQLLCNDSKHYVEFMALGLTGNGCQSVSCNVSTM